MYHVVSYFMFFPNITVGIGSCLRRFLTSLVFGFVLISRMDKCMLMKGYESLDAGKVHRVKKQTELLLNVARSWF